MGNLNIAEKVAVLLGPAIEGMGLELVDVEYVKEGSHWYLRIYIDKEGGVDLDDCTNVSHSVSDVLDRSDPIPGAYMLEVSSPGLERPLKKESDYEKFRGSLVSVHTKAPIQGFCDFSGYLVGLIEGNVVLEYEKEQVEIPRESVDHAHLALEF